MRLAALLLALCGETWDDYRGPARTGDAGDARPPLEWSEERNVRWKRAVHGRGWSSPVARDGRVWLTTATPDGTALSVLAFDLERGAALHDRVLFEVAEPQPRNALNSYASPSPVLDEERVYVSFGYAGLAALDARTGETLWQRRDLACDHMEGPGSSPILWGELLILHVDGGDLQYVAALDKRSGEPRWRRERSIPLAHLPRDLRKAYGTPVVLELEGEPVLVGSGAEASYGYDARDGRELWRLPHKGFSMSARPLAAGGLVVLNTGFMKPSWLALRPGGEGALAPEERVVWSYSKNVPTMASAVSDGERLYFVDDGGVATCLALATGERLWRERIGGEHCASPLLAAGRVYFFDREGRAVVVRAAAEHEVLAESRLDAGFMASPAALGRSLLLRTETHLYRVEAPAE